MNELLEILRGMADMLDGPQNAGNLVVPSIINRLRDASNAIERLEAENTALRTQREQPNEPLTLDKLREMARDGGYVWCADTDGTHPGLLCYVECLLDDGKEAHIWLLDNEGNAGQYNVRCMIECGAKFYRRKPEQEE